MTVFGFHVSDLLLAYDQDELSPEQSGRVARHLRGCGRCRAELESIRLAAAAIRQAPLHYAPDSLWNDIEAALAGPPPAHASVRRWKMAGAAFATACLAIAGILVVLMRSGHREPGWRVVRVEGTAVAGAGTLDVGDWLVTGPSTRARLAVSEIGEVEVEPNSRVRLLRAKPVDNRLSLARGTISAKIWAPPRLFFVETPSALAVDLGCAYKLTVDDHGAGLLRVTLGWVMLQERGREATVPAGAACRMRPGVGPGTPYFEDASAAFEQALARFDFDHDPDALPVILRTARPRDGLTLVHLLARVNPGERPVIVDRLTAMKPLPDGVTRKGALAADPKTLQRWIDDLAWSW